MLRPDPGCPRIATVRSVFGSPFTTQLWSKPTGLPPAAFRSLPIGVCAVKSKGVPFTGLTLPSGTNPFVGVYSAPLARRLVGPAGLARAAELANRHGAWAVVLCRPVPVLAEATVVFAGLVRAPIGRFLFVTAASNLGIAAGYAAIGAYSMRLDSFLMAFAGAIVVPGVALLVGRRLRRQR